MYESINDLPFVCQFNLPEAALKVYREAFNRAWKRAGDVQSRFHLAQTEAWLTVRTRFERDPYGRWMPKTLPFAKTRSKSKSSSAPKKRAAR
jgi:cation transport regulator ChaB